MVKSQLELYLEKLDESSPQITLLVQPTKYNVDTPSKLSVKSEYKYLFIFGFYTVLIVLFNGTLKDFYWCLTLFRKIIFKKTYSGHYNSVVPLNYTAHDVIRLIILFCLLMCFVQRHAFAVIISQNTSDTFLYSIVWRCLESILIVSTICSIFSAFVLSWILNCIDSKYKATHQSFLCLLGVIKRIQLVSLGRSLTHPMPPLFSLESGMMEQYGDDRVLVCRDVRSAMKNISLELLQSNSLVLSNFCNTIPTTENDTSDTDTNAEYNSYSTEVVDNFAAMARAAVESSETDIPSSPYLQSMAHLAFVQSVELFRAGTDKLIESRLSALVEHTSSGVGLDLTGSFWSEWLHRSWTLFLMVVECPLLSARLLCAIHNCQKQLKLASSGLQTQYASSTSLNSTEVESPVEANAHHFSSAYLDVRVRLTRLRGKYEEASHRLWLCDQALSAQEAMQCLLPDEVVSALSRDEGASKLPFDSVYKALAGLHATNARDLLKHLRLSQTSPINQDNETDLMSALDHFHNSLPPLTDWRDLDQRLKALLQGSESGIFPVKSQLTSSVVGRHCLCADGDINSQPALSADAFRQYLLNGDASSLSDAQEHSTGSDGDAHHTQRSIASNCDEEGVVEVFAATVPKQKEVTRKKRGKEKSDLQRRLQADRERDAMQAKSLMMELSTALVRKEGFSQLERVRTIVCKTDEVDHVHHEQQGDEQEDTTHLEIQQEMTTARMVYLQNDKVGMVSLDERVALDSCNATPTTQQLQHIHVPTMTLSNTCALAELRSILALQNRSGGGEEVCFSCSDDEE